MRECQRGYAITQVYDPRVGQNKKSIRLLRCKLGEGSIVQIG